ncbi:MAG: hypothetical protein ABIW36_03125, partial [Terrimesophilobacter sp.]
FEHHAGPDQHRRVGSVILRMEPPKPARATVWLLPDLALALALFTVLYAFAFYRAPEQLFRDSDKGFGGATAAYG